MNYSVKAALLLSVMMCAQKSTCGDFDAEKSLRGGLALIGLGITGAAIKFILQNPRAKTGLSHVGVLPKEAAVLLGSMGAFFSLSSNIPVIAPYGWLVPVAWGSLKVATSRPFRSLIGCIPDLGPALMGEETTRDFDILSHGQEITDTDKDGHTTKPDAAAAKSRAAGAMFAAFFVGAGIYVPVKGLLDWGFNYPQCMINLSGRGISWMLQYAPRNAQKA